MLSKGRRHFLCSPDLNNYYSLESIWSTYSRLDFEPSVLLNVFLTKTAKGFHIHNIQVEEGDKPKVFLYHENFGYNKSIDLISLSFTDVVSPHGRRFERVNHAHIKGFSNKIPNKVVTVVLR